MPDRRAPVDPDPVAAGLEPAPGRAIRWASWIGTTVFVITAVASAIAPNTFIAAGVATSLALFFAGIVLFFWAYVVAVNRSRTDLIGMGGLFFLAGTAPRSVQRSLLGSLAVQVVVGLVTAFVHPFTPLAFGVLAWMYGLALCGLWAARYGTFPPRPPEEKRGRRGAKAKTRSGGGEAASGPKPSGRTTPKGSTTKRSTKSAKATKGAGGSKTKGSKAKGSSAKSSYL
jgi:hypothetical protein